MADPVYTIYFCGYIALMISIGVYYSRKITSPDSYLIADWDVGFLSIAGSILATACGAAAFIGFVGLGFSTGIQGFFFWVVPATVFTVVLAVVFGRVLRKLKQYTISDVFALRFGKNAAFLPSVSQIGIYVIPTLAIQYIGMGTIFATFFGFNLKIGIFLGFAAIFPYTVLGGLPATIVTDKIQAVILTGGLLLLFVFGVHYAGGVTHLQNVPWHYWNPLGQSSVVSFLSLALTVGPFYMVWQPTWQRIFAAKNEKIAVRGVSFGFFLSGVVLLFSFLVGIVARSFLPLDTPPDLVFTTIISEIFPTILGGVVVVGLAAAIMSGGDSFIMMGSASVARDIYQQYMNPAATKTQMLHVSRWSTLFISVTALVVALTGRGIIPMYILVVKTVGAGLFFPFVALMFWRRATQKAILASMTAGIVVTLVWNTLGSPFIIEAVAGYVFSLIVLVVISFLTSHSPDEQVKAAYFEPLETKFYTQRLVNTEGVKS
ncbi:MAG: sodium:solute symporter family protein [Candidatus Methanofastidiosia archaeon]